MKPINLTISAFGPYKDKVVIDFTKLGENGIFLITGDTGAGKTSIFDAISFAIFGEVSGSNRPIQSIRSDFADSDTETFVELEFIHKNKIYRILRNPSYEKPKKKGEGFTKKPADASLEFDDNVVAGIKNVDTKIEEILGINAKQFKQIAMLAQGEYNINYSFTHPKTGKKLLLRVNCGSQMHLENQIGYECHALQLLEASGRTPKVLYVDGSRKFLDHGVLVMEYLPGKALDYHTDLKYAAECLADIHSVRIPESESGLIRPENPLIAILEECEEMVKMYMDSPLGKDRMKRKIRDLLDKAWKKAKEFHMEDSPYQCCINTELNSTNFLIGGEGKPNYLIDWEKPLFGDPAQDLGHFLAPTTTFWKTDVILKEEEIENFLNEYLKCVRARFDITGLKERTKVFMEITCLRGITWCAMAWVQYQQPDKLIINESTYRKLEDYLSDGFLEKIEIFLEQ